MDITVVGIYSCSDYDYGEHSKECFMGGIFKRDFNKVSSLTLNV